jgi:hypothetical protein
LISANLKDDTQKYASFAERASYGVPICAPSRCFLDHIIRPDGDGRNNEAVVEQFINANCD